MPVRTIGVIGAGTISSGIAQVATALADMIGLDVLVAVMRYFTEDFGIGAPRGRPRRCRPGDHRRVGSV
jgi:3-hydroxyacyl-CoA dehydrogenase